MMHRNVDRLMAEADLRALSVAAYAQSGEGITEFSERMREQLGRVAEVDEAQVALSETLDRDGLKELAGLGRIRSDAD